MRTSINLSTFSHVARDISSRVMSPHALPIVYFTGVPNVGDLLNEYLIPRLSGKEIVKVISSALPHLRAVGSVIGSSSSSSYIWGSGSIDGAIPQKRLRKDRVFALRGKSTHYMLTEALGSRLHEIPLGDPAILMPRFFRPTSEKLWRVGIIPHFSDESQMQALLDEAGVEGARIISVRQQPQPFIESMCECEFILSTSLHGIILADSYNVPNKWVSISNRLLGGTFKFTDYYSTTDSPRQVFTNIGNSADLKSVLTSLSSICSVNTFSQCQDALINCFPHSFTDRF